MSTIVLTLPYPVSANAYKNTRIIKNRQTGKPMALYYRTHEAEAFVKACNLAAHAAGITEPLTCKLELAYRLYPELPKDWQVRERKHGPDWDWETNARCIDGFNAEKVMADALQGIVYINDAQVWRGVWERMTPDEHGARLVVYVRQIPSKVPQEKLL